MAFIWRGVLTFIDEQGLKTSMNLDLGTSAGLDYGSEAAAANVVWSGIIDAYNDLSTANIYKAELVGMDEGHVVQTLPAEAEVAEEAVLAVHLTEAPDPEKFGHLRIPAPVDSIFLADGTTVDTNNALVQALTTAYNAVPVYISDGETIKLARGANGIDSGWLRFKSRSTR